MKKEVLEQWFLELLASHQPAREAVMALNDHILQRWDQEEAEREALLAKTKNHIEELADSKNRLIEALLGKQIDADAYKTHLTHLNEELEEAKVAYAALSGHRMGDMESHGIHGVLEFSKALLPNIWNRWQVFDLQQKQLLQRVMFPGGIEVGPQGVGTAVTGPVFSALGAISAGVSNLAPRV